MFVVFAIFLLCTTIVENASINHDQLISKILISLNESPYNNYKHTSGKLVSSEQKADILALIFDANVTCKISYPDVPCVQKTLRCNSFVRSNSDGPEILSTSCWPKEEPSAESDLGAALTQDVKNSKIELSHEAVFTDQDADIVAVNKHNIPCLGCPYDLNLNAEGVDTLVDSALKHVESEREEKYNVIKILRVQEQVIAGLRYILLLEIIPSVCPKNNYTPNCASDLNKNSVVCEVVYLERPWLHTGKNIVKNNCTVSQEFYPKEKASPEPRTQNIRPINDDFLSELESQIIQAEPQMLRPVESDFNTIPKRNEIEEPEGKYKFPNAIINEVIEAPSERNAISSTTDSNNIPDLVIVECNHPQANENSSNDIQEEVTSERNLKAVGSESVENNFTSTESEEVVGTSEAQQEIRVKREANNDDGSSSSSSSSSEEKARKKIDDVDDDDHEHDNDDDKEKRNGDSSSSSSSSSSNDDDDNDFKKKHPKPSRKKRGIPGGIQEQPTDNENVKKYLTDALLYMDSKSPHPYRFTIHKILTVSSQVVAGTLWRVKAEIILSDCPKNSKVDLENCARLDETPKKTCYFKIWDQPWLLKGREINITCENEDVAYSFRAKRYIEDDEEESDLDVEFDMFKNFIVKYKKNFKDYDEFHFRFKVFRDNLKTMRLLNKFEQGTATYGITQFAHLTKHEFSQMHGLREDLRQSNAVPFHSAKIPDIELPTEFDWRQKNAVTEIKNQGMCGSCWAFSTTGNVEGQYAIKYGKLLEFSEQELVDCDKMDEGCSGGLMDNAYRAIEKLGGLETEQDYPYDGVDEKCHFKNDKIRVQLSGALNISHNETDMAKWLVQNGPIAIGINANAMQFYVGGVSHPWKTLCNPNNLDHGVLIVGYGVHTYPKFKKSLPYWIVKNSWGKTWGEQGYYRVYRGDGTCGLNQTPSSSIVA